MSLVRALARLQQAVERGNRHQRSAEQTAIRALSRTVTDTREYAYAHCPYKVILLNDLKVGSFVAPESTPTHLRQLCTGVDATKDAESPNTCDTTHKSHYQGSLGLLPGADQRQLSLKLHSGIALQSPL